MCMPELREPAHQVSPWAKRMWLAQGAITVLVLLAVQVGWWFLNDEGDRTANGVVAGVWLVASVAYLVIMPRWRYRVHRWETTPTAVYTQTGWLTQEKRIAPVSRIQTVDLARGPLAQLFRLASVTVTTASAAGPLRIHGLDLADAQRLVAELTAETAAEQGDAT